MDFYPRWLIKYHRNSSIHLLRLGKSIAIGHSWQRVHNPPVLWRPPILSTPVFSNFVQLPSQSPPPLLFFYLVSLVEWVIAPYLMCYSTHWYYGSTHVEPWYHSTRRTLLCDLCNNASNLRRLDTCGLLLVLWFDIMHTHRHTVDTGAVILTHPYNYINTICHVVIVAASVTLNE